MTLYILEQPSSWSTSRIPPSFPQSRDRLNLLLDLFPQVYSCLLWPTQYLAVCSSSSHFTLDPFLACWRPDTCTQVNSTLVLHHIHMDTHIYIILIIFVLLLYTSSTPSGRPTVLDPSCRAQYVLSNYKYMSISIAVGAEYSFCLRFLTYRKLKILFNCICSFSL